MRNLYKSALENRERANFYPPVINEIGRAKEPGLQIIKIVGCEAYGSDGTESGLQFEVEASFRNDLKRKEFG